MAQLIVRSAKHSAWFLGLLVAIRLVHALETPDAAINPVSGSIELTDVVSDGDGSKIRFVEHAGGDVGTDATFLSASGASDHGPRIEVKPNGDTWVVWWRDSATPEVLYRFRDFETGSWSAEGRVSGAGEHARHPDLAHDGSTTWIVYGASAASGTQVMVTHTEDDPEPIPHATAIATTTFGGDPDVRVHTESGHVWVTWVDSSTEVAWSLHSAQSGAWSSPQRAPYVGSSVESARAVIRSIVLGE